MAKRHVELSFLQEVASVAELRLRFLEKEFVSLGVVRRMAGDAAYIVLRVLRIQSIHVLRPTGVAGHAALVDFLCRMILKAKNFGYVAASLHVR
jgi:hypothetical protein